MIKIIGKIELAPNTQPERKEHLRNKEEILRLIDEGMEEAIPLINNRLSHFENAPSSLLDSDGSIRMEAFDSVYGGQVVKQDSSQSRQQEHGFYQTYDTRNQERYGESDPQRLLEMMKSAERMRDGNISEEALFLLMNKISGNQFITMRSSIYDDYSNGTDLLLVDTRSGKTICAFDETVEGKNSRLEKKMKRAKDHLKGNRGMQVKYGVSFDSSTSSMTLGKVEKIPPLFLAIEKSDLEQLLQTMDFRIDSPSSELEKKVMKNIIEKVKIQIQEFHTLAPSQIDYKPVKDFLNLLESNLSFLES